MLHLVFGLVWIAVVLSLLLTKQAAEDRGQNVTFLATFAGMLAVYNFVRCGVAWMVRRRRHRADENPACPRCGRPMRLVDLGPEQKSEKERWQLICCGYRVQIEDDEERRRIIAGL